MPPSGSALDNQDEWVSPFGNLRVKGCSHLTAAYRSVPRPSSPVCAKASTNCPYLTLESPHHQHQRWRRPLRAGSLGIASSGISVRVLNLSQISVNCQHLARHRTSRSRASLKADTFTASILRTHSQCQTRRPSGTLTAASQAADLVSSSLGWMVVEPIGIEPMT